VGGVEATVRLLAEHLVCAGHEVTVISFDSAREDRPRPYKHILLTDPILGSYVRRAEHGAFYKAYWQIRCWRNPSLNEKLISAINEANPDVIHTHQVRGFPLNLWTNIRENSTVKMVHTCHDIELLSPIGWVPVSHSSVFIRRWLYFWSGLIRSASEIIDDVTFPSYFLMEIYKRNKLFGKAKMSVVVNIPDIGDSLNAFPVVEHQDGEALKILFMGRLVAEKGILELIRNVIKLNKANQRIQLRVAGNGPLIDQITALCAADSALEYMGIVEGEQKWKLLQWAEVTAVPSAADESFCLVAAESISAGRPVLASSRGALPEVVDHGVTGWLYGGSGQSGLLKGLELLLAERELIPEYSRNCLAQNRFTAKRFVKGYLEVFQRQIQEDG